MSIVKKRQTVTVNLVKNKTTFYPKTDADYEVLKTDFKLPINSIDENFIPLLLKSSELYGLHFNIVEFSQLEDEMFDKLRAKWPFDLDFTKTSLVLKAPKNLSVTKLETVVSKLRVWYARHGLVLDVSSKKSSKSIKIVLTKRERLQ